MSQKSMGQSLAIQVSLCAQLIMDINRLSKILDFYEIPPVVSFSKVERGYISHNYRVETRAGIYFLKQHSKKVFWQIDSIEKAESFFINGGIPVIKPLQTKTGELHIVVDEKCYVLYPFVEGISYERGNIPIQALESMGKMLADIHLLTKEGITDTYKEFPYYKLSAKEKIIDEIEQCLAVIQKIQDKTAFDILVLDSLTYKKEFIEKFDSTSYSFITEDRHLCHGDYHVENIFFDQTNNISYVFDLDMSGPAPRLYELFRSCMLSCFNHIYIEDRFKQARILIDSYYKKYPFTQKEFRDVLEAYYLNQIWSAWIEKSHYLEGSTRVDHIYKPCMDTIYYLRDHRDEFFNELTKDLFLTN